MRCSLSIKNQVKIGKQGTVPCAILSPEQIKGMSKADWYELGMELQIAGYDVFKK